MSRLYVIIGVNELSPSAEICSTTSNSLHLFLLRTFVLAYTTKRVPLLLLTTIPSVASVSLIPIPRIPMRGPKRFSKHVDSATGYWYYENVVTGERHWDRPLDGVAALQPKSPRPEEKLVDAA